MKIFKILALSVVVLLFFVACENSDTNSNVNNADSSQVTTNNVNDDVNTVVAENFDAFYTSFISDFNFQMERINFPIEGLLIEDYGEEEDWTPDNWMFLDKNVDDIDRNELTVEIDEQSERVSHKIYIPNSGFSVSYAFELIDNKWYLIERTDSYL